MFRSKACSPNGAGKNARAGKHVALREPGTQLQVHRIGEEARHARSGTQKSEEQIRRGSRCTQGRCGHTDCRQEEDTLNTRRSQPRSDGSSAGKDHVFMIKSNYFIYNS